MTFPGASIAGVVVRSFSASSSDAATNTATNTATNVVVNIRSASSPPDDRLDLIDDLSVLLKVSSAVNPVAAESDMKPAALVVAGLVLLLSGARRLA